MKIAIQIIFLVFLISCKRNLDKENTFYDFVYKTKKIDTIEYRKEKPFVFIKTGKFLSNQTTNGLLIKNIKDSTYTIELYTLTVKGWLKNDNLNFTSKYMLQFYTEYKDYDFDGQKDIYIQSTASNGYSLSRGNLIMINRQTKKLFWVKEAKNLANMSPDENLKAIISESVDWCPDLKVCKWINKWKNGKLVTIKKDCPCK